MNVLAQSGYVPSSNGPLVALGIIAGLAFAVYLAELAVAAGRERAARRSGRPPV